METQLSGAETTGHVFCKSEVKAESGQNRLVNYTREFRVPDGVKGELVKLCHRRLC